MTWRFMSVLWLCCTLHQLTRVISPLRQATGLQNPPSPLSTLYILIGNLLPTSQTKLGISRNRCDLTVPIMAFRSTNYWSQMIAKLRGCATYATSTAPKMKAYSPTADEFYSRHTGGKQKKVQLRGDFVPVYVAIGMIVVSTTLGLYTAKQQLAYSPTVRVRKKTRERLTEIEEPETVVHWSEKFFDKSFFRKVAHVQESHYLDQSMPDPIHKDAFAHKPKAVTLKDLGVDPTLRYY